MPMPSAFEILAAGGPIDSIVQERNRLTSYPGENNFNLLERLSLLVCVSGALGESIGLSHFTHINSVHFDNIIRKSAVHLAAISVLLIEHVDHKSGKGLDNG